LEQDNSQLVCVALSPDGKWVAAGDPHDKTIKLWNAGTGTFERTLSTGEAQPWSLGFSPDSKTLLAGGQTADGSGDVTLWNVETGDLKHTLKREKFGTSVAFSPNGKIAGSGGAGAAVELWDIEKGELILSLPGLESVTRSVAFSPDGRTLAAGGPDGKI